MNHINFFKELFEPIEGYRKVVLLKFSNKNDGDLIKEVGFSENDIIRLSLEFRFILNEQNQDYLEYIKNEEESIIERIPYK